MTLKQTLEFYELLDDAHIDGAQVAEKFYGRDHTKVSCDRVTGGKGFTDVLKIEIVGTQGKAQGGSAPTLGVIGRLGGIGARPARIGLVSDADGAIAALAVADKLATMAAKGDRLAGDVIITTHICPNAPVRPHKPVDFMDSPVTTAEILGYEVDERCDAVISIDTTKGNRFLNQRGVAISPTVKQGYILHPAEDLLRLMEFVSGEPALCLPLSTADITPYSNNLYHINSIMQPATATDAPVVGLALTTQVAVPGCATGASHETDIAYAAKFCIEVAKAYGRGECDFYDVEQFNGLVAHYGSMQHLVTDPMQA